MAMSLYFRRFALATLGALSLAACELRGSDFYDGPNPEAASIGDVTYQNRALRDIPAPNQRVTVAVYGLPDLTGQYKEDEQGQNLSRAVTQGGAAVLIKALQDAGDRRWFSVLDRSNLDNLLRERQIVTEMRRIYRNEQQIDPSALGPLDHAGIIIEGAIVGYDTNTMTGGYGVRFLGLGPNQRWKLDTITVTLRAVSTETGEVLTSVTVRKPLASASTQGIIFTYVELDKLLEAEAGVAMNEPKQFAIEKAVEKGVMALVAEGAMLGLWTFADQAEGERFVRGYNNDKFDGMVPPRTTDVVRPRTRNAAQVVQTVPRARQVARPRPVVERRIEPQRQQPAAPPNNPDSEEVIG
ncbi:hypothetical protein BOO69_14355 [Sulfitobacter alexandrii]|uniref:Curlin n=1 Tax=Sulfitobacter alexandrii TaxID=1917485 RepID=A0A1J0WJY3_9RHOB|nr:CsgG/HfaB family protein [Sulfitobacter alexandrii]APE44462.1 hypothetical protein BOO69_14355 [Sulfitobacter alexandrii]